MCVLFLIRFVIDNWSIIDIIFIAVSEDCQNIMKSEWLIRWRNYACQLTLRVGSCVFQALHGYHFTIDVRYEHSASIILIIHLLGLWCTVGFGNAHVVVICQPYTRSSHVYERVCLQLTNLRDVRNLAKFPCGRSTSWRIWWYVQFLALNLSLELCSFSLLLCCFKSFSNSYKLLIVLNSKRAVRCTRYITTFACLFTIIIRKLSGKLYA